MDIDDMPLSKAVEKMTDSWIEGSNYSAYTVQRLRDGYKAAEHRVHLTAIAVGGLALIAGIVIGKLWFGA